MLKSLIVQQLTINLLENYTKQDIKPLDYFMTGISNEPRDEKWAEPWQTHPEFRKESSGNKKGKKSEKRQTSSGFIGKIFDSGIRLVFQGMFYHY